MVSIFFRSFSGLAAERLWLAITDERERHGGGASSVFRCLGRATGIALIAWVCALSLAGVTPALADSCPNAQLRYGYGAQLPDCRAYEQVTPVDKDGTSINGAFNLQEASTSGNAFMFYGGTGVPGADGAANYTEFEASRSAGGWASQGVLPPEVTAPIASVLGWTPDLASVIDSANRPGTGTSLLVRDEPSAATTTVVPFNPNVGPYSFDGASADGSLVFFEAVGAGLAAGTAAGQDNLYVWDRATGTVSLVGVLPAAQGGGAPSGGSFGGAYDWQDADPTRGGARAFNRTGSAISTDGSRAYFTAGGTGQLYLRTDPAGADAATVQVSASQKTNGSGSGGTDPNGPQPAAFMDATPDGSDVLFTSPEELTNDAMTGTADQGNDLYIYDVGGQKLTDISLPNPGITDTNPNGAAVQGVLGMSNDGSYVYFAANGVLAPGASQGTCNGSASNGISSNGVCNLYVWHDGVISFIAQLNTGGINGLDLGGTPQFETSDATNWLPSLNDGSGGSTEATARVTADGTTLLFSSQEQLTSSPTAAWSELYRYSAPSGSLTCVSCDPTPAASTAGASTLTLPLLTAGPPSWAPFLSRNLSADGDRVFFDTSDALLPQDTNGVQDVYEWEADGSGSCDSTAQNGGCLYLISSGQSPDPSYFADSSASGDDVFFFTTQPLVGQDQDQLDDIYDARVDGGLASQNPQPVASCVGEACRGTVSAPASLPTVGGTVAFSGPGNIVSHASAAKVSVLTRVVRGASFVIKVRVPAKGRVTVSGAAVQTTSRSAAGAGMYAVRVSLTAKQKTALALKRKLRLTLRVRYAPATGAASVARVALTVAPARKAQRKHTALATSHTTRGGAR